MNLNGQVPDEDSPVVPKAPNQNLSIEVKNLSSGVREIWDLVINVPYRRCINLGTLLKLHLRFFLSKVKMILTTFYQIAIRIKCDNSVYIITLTFGFALLLHNILLIVIKTLSCS